MKDRSNFDELEMLAYADGFLDGDPVRKADFERRLADAGKEFERVREFEAQNRALRRIGREYLDEPVPQRLLDALEYTPRSRLGAAKRVAALVTLICATAVIGWLVGQYDAQPVWSPRTSIEQAYQDYFTEELASLPRIQHKSLRQANNENALSGRLSMIFKIPNMAKYGYRIVDTYTVENTDGEVVRLTYRSQNGDEFSLFVRPRWKEQGSSIQVDNDGDISVAFWLDGPLASAVVSKLPPTRARAIAEAVRKELRTQRLRTPVYDAESPSNEKNAGDTVTQAVEPLQRPSPDKGGRKFLELPARKPL